MSEAGARSAYERGHEQHSGVAAALEARSRALGTARLLIVAFALALLGVILWGRSWGWPSAALGGLAIVFAALVVVHARVDAAKERALAAARFHARGLARLDLAWDRLPVTSERFRSKDHPFTGDLDVFGRASLMQLVDATETNLGERRLAALLSLEGVSDWPRAIAARQEAVRDLAARQAFREALAVAAGSLSDERPDPSALLAWAEGGTGSQALVNTVVSWVVPAIGLGAIGLAELGVFAKGPATLVVMAIIALGAFFGLRTTPTLEAASARESSATRWRPILAAIEKEPFQAPLLREIQGRLLASGLRASEEMAALARIVGFVDARRNELFRFVIGPLFMWDLHCERALLRWRARAGVRLREWLDALGETEALASVGAFAFEHPDFAWPVLAPEPQLEAKGLAHPLLPASSRVGNDVQLPSPGVALVVTGSNMSGKSTLLRAMGINTVLANAGGPVCAGSMQVGPLRVATSMRVEDSLSHGVSHFYAELARLKRVIDLAKRDTAGAAGKDGAVLFLLDEILHGTNSRERVLGASAVVRQLLTAGALGAVSTHDLGITALEQNVGVGGRVTNVHLEEHVEGDKMTFDYVLRPGIVQSSNALRLMRAVGIDVREGGAP
jgi:hypothetical protein